MRPDADVLDRLLLQLAAGEPKWVLVDKRVLDVLLGPLADLVVQVPYSGGFPSLPPGEEPYAWDDDDLCS